MPEFDPSMIPPRPELIPPELRAASVDNTDADWAQRVPPQAVGMFVAAVARWLSHPRFGVAVAVDASEAGWQIRIDLPPAPTRDDVLSVAPPAPEP